MYICMRYFIFLFVRSFFLFREIKHFKDNYNMKSAGTLRRTAILCSAAIGTVVVVSAAAGIVDCLLATTFYALANKQLLFYIYVAVYISVLYSQSAPNLCHIQSRVRYIIAIMHATQPHTHTQIYIYKLDVSIKCVYCLIELPRSFFGP